MSIKTALFLPHPLLLIPSIGKENSEKLKETEQFYRQASEKLSREEVETLIVFSPHGPLQKDYFLMNSAEEYEINFEDFGDFSTKSKIQPDMDTAYRLREFLEDKAILQMMTQEKLDHGTGVPVFMLTGENNLNPAIIPIYYSGLSLDHHRQIGKNIGEFLEKESKKTAIIASGDMSHRINKNSPAGYSPQGSKFDKKITRIIKKSPHEALEEIFDLEEEFIEEAGECGLKSLIMLLGALEATEAEFKKSTYGAPFGVGYLSAEWEI